MNLSPSAGYELDGPHFAVVISTARFAKVTGFAIVIPGTSKFHAEQRMAGQQLMVRLPPIEKLTKDGWLYPHQVKSIDYRERNLSFVAKLNDDEFLIDVMDRVRALIDPDTV